MNINEIKYEYINYYFLLLLLHFVYEYNLSITT